MQVYRKILVTMDCSPADDAIIEHVTKLALQNEATVCLLHVVHSHTLDQDRALHTRAQEYMESRRAQLAETGVDVHVRIKSGEPDAQILTEIEETDYDLVAMGTHGHSFIGDLLFGSVSRTLKHKIHIPLLLINRHP